MFLLCFIFCGGGERLLWIRERASSEAGRSGEAQSRHHQTEQGHVGGWSGAETGEPRAAARKPKVKQERLTKMSGLYREEPLGKRQPSPGLESPG